MDVLDHPKDIFVKMVDCPYVISINDDRHVYTIFI